MQKRMMITTVGCLLLATLPAIASGGTTLSTLAQFQTISTITPSTLPAVAAAAPSGFPALSASIGGTGSLTAARATLTATQGTSLTADIATVRAADLGDNASIATIAGGVTPGFATANNVTLGAPIAAVALPTATAATDYATTERSLLSALYTLLTTNNLGFSLAYAPNHYVNGAIAAPATPATMTLADAVIFLSANPLA